MYSDNKETLDYLIEDMEDLRIVFLNFLNKRVYAERVLNEISRIKRNLESFKEVV